jgi:predicted  nucleic acid-binding Zn-ribbon protein
MFNEIEQLIDELIKTISKIRQNRETNVSAVKEQKILVESEIRELRRKIDNHLDKLQESPLQSSLISNTYDGNFRYPDIGIVV